MAHSSPTPDNGMTPMPAGSAGEPLRPEISERLGRGLGFDASVVRIHRDTAAARAAEATRSRAFAHGASIYFGADEFSPETDSGMELLAHETMHVKQYMDGRLRGTAADGAVSDPDDPEEVEARRAAESFRRTPQTPEGGSEAVPSSPTTPPPPRRIQRCPMDEEGNPLFQTQVFLGQLWYGTEIWIPFPISARIDADTCTWLDATVTAEDEIATELSEIFNPEGELTRERWSFITGSALAQTLARDLRHSADQGAVSLSETRSFIERRREIYDDVDVIQGIEDWLAANSSIPTPVDWGAVIGGLQAYTPEDESTAVNDALLLRYDLLVSLIRAEIEGRDPAPTASAPDSESLGAVLYQYVTATDPETWGDAIATHSEAFLDVWLEEIAALTYLPEDFDISEYAPDLDEESIERERNRVIDRFLTEPAPDGGRYGQATWAEELMVGFVLDRWTISGLDTEDFLANLDLTELREQALQHISERFLAEARRDPDLVAALRDYGIERARWDMLRLITTRAQSLETSNTSLVERLQTEESANLDPEDLAIISNPYAYYSVQADVASASYDFFERMERGTSLEENVVALVDETAAALDMAIDNPAMILLLELIMAARHIQEGFEEQERAALDRFRDELDIEYDYIADIIYNLTDFADAWIVSTWIPTVKEVAIEMLEANRDELQARLDDWEGYSSLAIARYQITAAALDQLANDLESGEYETVEHNGHTIDVSRVPDLRDAANLMRAQADALIDPESAEERREMIQEAIDGFDEVVEGIRDEDPYKPWQLGPEVARRARERLGLAGYGGPTTYGMALSRTTVADENPFIMYAISRWEFLESTEINIALFVALGVLTIAAIVVPGTVGLVLAAADLAVGVAMGAYAAVDTISDAYALRRMARLDINLSVYGLTEERADELVRSAWLQSIGTALLTAGLAAIGGAGLFLAGRRAYRGWRYANVVALEGSNPQLLAQLTNMTRDLRQLEGLLRATDDADLLRNLLLHGSGDEIGRLLGQASDARALLDVLGHVRNATQAERLLGMMSDTRTLANLLAAPRSTAEIQAALRAARISMSGSEVAALRTAIADAHGLSLPTSSQRLEAYLDTIWAERSTVLSTPASRNWPHGPSRGAYRVYNRATEANPLGIPEADYLTSVADLRTGRPAGAVSNVQGNPMTGFHRFEREAADLSLVQERVYLNVRADAAPDVMRHVVREIVDNPQQFPGVQMAKLTGPRGVPGRADAIVIYVDDTASAGRVLDSVRGYQQRNPGQFMTSTPPVTEPVAPGISVGSEPLETGASFGSIRAESAAQALEETVRAGGTREDFIELARDYLRGRGVDVDLPHTNLPGGAP